jgi:hypothetical protein
MNNRAITEIRNQDHDWQFDSEKLAAAGCRSGSGRVPVVDKRAMRNHLPRTHDRELALTSTAYRPAARHVGIARLDDDLVTDPAYEPHRSGLRIAA